MGAQQQEPAMSDPIRVYYNSACPVCAAGIGSQRERMAGCDVQWIDVHSQPDSVAAVGAELEAVRERLHVTAADGSVLVGIDALVQLWSQTPGQRWLARIARQPGLRRALGAAYNLFARRLYRWNLRRGHWQPKTAAPAARPFNADPAELEKFSKLASRWWDPHSEFRPLHEINPLRLDWIDSLASLAGKDVLDVGCGGGILAEAMARKGARVTGIDLAQAPLSVATLHARASGVSVNYVFSSAETLAAQQPGRFDVVTCMEMLEHVPDPAAVIAACAGLVKPGGWVIFSTINRNPLSWLVAIVGGEYLLRILPVGTHQWRRFIKPAELLRDARPNGLALQDARGLGYNPFTRRFRLHRFQGVGYLLAMKAAALRG
jgi:2-polyprenyl-6-hydroxyphenyl methylase/3-demethylubiquinone-9 3-methyltransferase